jgi:hypothetical protein
MRLTAAVQDYEERAEPMRSITSLGARAMGAVLLLLALPAAAGAVTGLPTLSATPGTANGYTAYFSATSFGAELDFLRTSHGATQDHTLQNNGPAGVTYTAAADLSTAKIVAKWGSHGKVSMTFTAKGRAHKALPKGCTGKPALSRTGILAGTLTAKLDKRFFKTFKRTRISATLSQPGEFSCGGGVGGFGGPGLSVLGAGKLGGLSVTFVRAGKHGKVSETANLSQTSVAGNWTLRHTITETAPASALKIASDASSATAKGAGPFLGGTLLFHAVGTHTSQSATGKPSGSFVAKFDSIGRQKLARGSGANVSQP